MKNILTIITVFFTFNLYASTVIHQGCSDHTFAYNTMYVTETDQEIHFKLNGSTIFKIFGVWEGNAVADITIDKSLCKFSDDSLLISCNHINKITVIQTKFPWDANSQQAVELEDFNINILYFEGASDVSGFELTSSYRVKKTKEYMSNKTSFIGTRNLGCTNF